MVVMLCFDWLVFGAKVAIEEQFIGQVSVTSVLYLVTIWLLLIVTRLERAVSVHQRDAYSDDS